MDIDQYLVLAIFAGTILALVSTNQRPSLIFAASLLALIASQQLVIGDVINNFTNQGLITLVLLLLVSSAVDKTSLIKRLGRTLVTASFNASYWRLFGLTFFSSALLNNTAIVASFDWSGETKPVSPCLSTAHPIVVLRYSRRDCYPNWHINQLNCG